MAIDVVTNGHKSDISVLVLTPKSVRQRSLFLPPIKKSERNINQEMHWIYFSRCHNSRTIFRIFEVF
jgi:hypothetical protein